MSVIPEIQERLRLAIPASTDVAVLRAVYEGIQLADDLFAGGMLLDNQMGIDVRGLIRRVGIAVRFREYCQKGDIPMAAEIKQMPKGRWHWLEIRKDGLRAHMCRTEDVYRFPDEADSRQDLRLAIQPDLLSWFERDRTVAEIIRDVPELYAWLTYRIGADGSLSHLCWASPAPDIDQYIAHINILSEITKAGVQPPSAPPPDPKERLKFRDEVRQEITNKKNSENNKASGE